MNNSTDLSHCTDTGSQHIAILGITSVTLKPSSVFLIHLLSLSEEERKPVWTVMKQQPVLLLPALCGSNSQTINSFTLQHKWLSVERKEAYLNHLLFSLPFKEWGAPSANPQCWVSHCRKDPLWLTVQWKSLSVPLHIIIIIIKWLLIKAIHTRCTSY